MSTIDLGARYEPIRELGSGGMGRVFLVRDLHLKKELALKLLHGPEIAAEDLAQVQKEFQLLSEVEHPGIARAHDFGYLDGRPYFTSEHIAGEPLCAVGPLENGAMVLRLGRDLAEAVSFLHSSKILHLDIKPSNIILPAARDRGRAVLIDFGLFRRGFEGEAGAKIKGSLPYMAPECFRGEKLGPWTDVYALGVTLYEAATGSLPRAVEESHALQDIAAWNPAPRPPSQLKPSLPADLDRVILKCLALDPRCRFPSGGELLAAIGRAEGMAPSGGLGPTLPAPTVGREAELREVDRFLAGLLSGAEGPAAIIITGPRGMGQTHLLRELKVRAQTRGLRCYLETGYPGRPTAPGSVLRSLTGHIGGDPSGRDPTRNDPRKYEGEARSRWERFLAQLRRPRRPARSEATEGERRLRRAGEVALAAGEVREALVLAVDGLQFWDEVSAGLLIDLVRYLGEKPRGERPPIGIALAYREEGAVSSMLQELTEYVLQPQKGSVIHLGPLGPKETLELYRQRGGPETEGSGGFSLFQETGGSPAKIAALASHGGSHALEIPQAERPRGAGYPARGPAPRIDRESRLLLLVLDLIQRPATAAELARFLGSSAQRANRGLERLRDAGLASEPDLASGEKGWVPEAAARNITGRVSLSERRKLHGRIARALSGGRRQPSRLVEAVRHFRAARTSPQVVKFGLPAARHLKSSYQNRAALELLRAILEAIPQSRQARRLEVALELAELHSRFGDLDQGIGILREMLPRSRRLPKASRKRAVLALAALYSRRGDYQRADLLFHEGLEGSRQLLARKKGPRRQEGLSRQEILFFINEHAAMKCAVGEHGPALELCEEGLRLAGGGRSARIREVALNLYATRANVALRTYDFEPAIRDFETSLEIAEAIGSPASQATILNNLGVVYMQRDRYREAIHVLREAERNCLQVDEGPSLASIYGNLAVLYARTGDFNAMERALSAGERLVPEFIGRRQEFFLQHARGLCRLIVGRYAEARVELEKAVALGEAMGDRHVISFDGVYRAEALIFEGAYGEAARELRRFSEPQWPGRVRKMALSRRAFLGALTADEDSAELAAGTYAELSAERPVPYLDAWDDLFSGWALSLRGRHDRADPLLERGERFFRGAELHPALSLCSWVRAEALFLQGEGEKALEILRKDPVSEEGKPAERSGLAAVLWPLLEARLLLDGAAGHEKIARSADLLGEAGAALVGNPLPEWEARLEALRGALVPGESGAERRRRDLAHSLPEEARERYLNNRYWKAWTQLSSLRLVGESEGRGQPGGGPLGPGAGTETAVLAGKPGGARSLLVGKSPGMRRLFTLLDRLRETDLPVLITGETGSGKEVIARVIHEESRRAAKAFQVVDCATLPPALLEVELFGARQGAFTGLTEDRPGILLGANGGTVLIDEITGAALEAQAKLLRVLSSGSLRAVGAETETKIDVRFLFSTSRDLEAEVREGRFRRDLQHRIQVLSLRVPPLRERAEDLPELLQAILTEGGEPAPALGRGVLEKLRGMPWPGNIRELRNVLARARMESPLVLSVEAIDRASADPRTSTLFPRNVLAQQSLPALKAHLEREYLIHHFRRLEGSADALSRFLGIRRKQLYRRCERLGIRLRAEKK